MYKYNTYYIQSPIEMPCMLTSFPRQETKSCKEINKCQFLLIHTLYNIIAGLLCTNVFKTIKEITIKILLVIKY